MKTFIFGAVVLLVYGGCCSTPESSTPVNVYSDSVKADTVIKLSVDTTVLVDTTK